MTQVFICREKADATVKVQLEIPNHVLDAYKKLALRGNGMTTKQTMEKALIDWAVQVKETILRTD